MIQIETINAFNEYLSGVTHQANHHEKIINEVAPTVAWWAREDIRVQGDKSRDAVVSYGFM